MRKLVVLTLCLLDKFLCLGSFQMPGGFLALLL